MVTMRKIRFVTALDLIKCLKQVEQQRFNLSFAPLYWLPSNISTMIWAAGSHPFIPIYTIHFLLEFVLKSEWIFSAKKWWGLTGVKTSFTTSQSTFWIPFISRLVSFLYLLITSSFTPIYHIIHTIHTIFAAYSFLGKKGAGKFMSEDVFYE